VFVIDLKLALFLLLAGVAALAGLAAWLARRVWGAAPPGEAVPDAPEGLLGPALAEAPFGLLILAGERVELANAYARELLRLPPMPQELPDADWVEVLAGDRRAAAAGAPTEMAGRYRTLTFASGRTARWWVTAWDGRDVVFLLDVTEQQRAEQAGRALVNDLAHELRTPVATLMTHLEVLGLDDVDAAMRRQSLALAKDEAGRMARLVNDMLELGRLETAAELTRRPVNLVTLVEDVVLQCTPDAVERRLHLSLETTSPLPQVLGDADRLRQVFLNLLDNALKYAWPSDRVVVSLDTAPGGIACAVCDTGPGVPAEHLPHITRRFYRGDAPEAVTGSGLGLAMVSEILRRHDSTLEIESPVADGRGTCVRFVLPVAEG
jgi:two-component system phosphate regulon sensor histidine kinase PhoR